MPRKETDAGGMTLEVLAERLAAIKIDINRNTEITSDLHDRMFKDNGRSSFQTVLNNHTRAIKALGLAMLIVLLIIARDNPELKAIVDVMK